MLADGVNIEYHFLKLLSLERSSLGVIGRAVYTALY